MNGGIRATVIIAVAFAIGAIAPLLGLLVAAAMIGAAWASRPKALTYQDRDELLELQRLIEQDRQRHR